MRIFSTPLSRGMVLLLMLNAIPTYETMFDSYRPSWTALGRDDLEDRTGTFVRLKEDVVFAIHLDSFDVHFKERWHRLRIGYPFSPITIDFEQRKKQVQGRIETNWLFMRLGITGILWALLESCLSLMKRERRVIRDDAATRGLNNSFMHGVAAYSAFASAPLFHGHLTWLVAAMICGYAGWHQRAYLAAFLGGIVVAVVGWTTIGVLRSSDVGANTFLVVPLGLLVFLPPALAAYVVGRVAFMIVRRRSGRMRRDA